MNTSLVRPLLFWLLVVFVQSVTVSIHGNMYPPVLDSCELMLVEAPKASDRIASNSRSRWSRWRQFWQERKREAKTYLEEVKNTRGLRLLLKVDDGNFEEVYFGQRPPPPSSALGRALFDTNPFSYIGRLRGRNYVFRPFLGTYEAFVRYPVHRISQLMGPRPYQPTRPVFFAIMMAGSIALTEATIHAIDQNSVETFKANAALRTSDHLERLKYDFRLSSVREALNSGQVTKEAAVEQIQLTLILYDHYYEMRPFLVVRKPYSELTEEERSLDETLLGMPILMPLRTLVEKGVQPSEEFLVPETSEGPLSKEQIHDLLISKDDVLLTYLLIENFFKAPSEYARAQEVPLLKDLSQDIFLDPLVQAVVNEATNASIPVEDAIFKIQEYAFWLHNLKVAEILKVKIRRDPESKEAMDREFVGQHLLSR